MADINGTLDPKFFCINVPLVAITGHRDSGKTTAVERIVQDLSGRGYRIGTVKHCHHGFDVDKPGKDSWRHRKAGAYGTVLMGPTGFALLGGTPPTEDPRVLAMWLFPDADLVLAEGFHWLPLPRIEVLERDGGTRESHPEGEVVGRLPFHFGSGEVAILSDQLEARYLKQEMMSP